MLNDVLTQRGDMMEAYRKRLTSDDKEVRLKAAIAWSVWEGSCSRLLPNKSYADQYVAHAACARAILP